ncbi:MAG TPA: hypothetical protein VKE27_11815 [Candidatus Dormibacteraeota bacterium]|nr:hypothetical protein [Candidatus Dormibacteraeota bacterium]
MEKSNTLDDRQKMTLDLGLVLVMTMLWFGTESGRWSIWAVLLGVAGYVIWVIAYSEITVQIEMRRRAARFATSSD